ncbi:hypothetical protein [Nonomuraea sp. NPDC049758]|uniref:hypothetical protein n=1 Tax=Nonomuraea sp. NPDC049758 TaxID=3154360 RepID=UPI003420C967
MTNPIGTQLTDIADATADLQIPLADLVQVTITVSPCVGFPTTIIRYLRKSDAEALQATAREKRVL